MFAAPASGTHEPSVTAQAMTTIQRCRMHEAEDAAVRALDRPVERVDDALAEGSSPPADASCSHRDASIGVSEKLTNIDTAIENAIVTPKLARNCPECRP